MGPPAKWAGGRGANSGPDRGPASWICRLGTWDLGLGTWDLGPGTGDLGTGVWGLGTGDLRLGTWGLGLALAVPHPLHLVHCQGG
jgi:hypothetical protein